FGVGGGWNAEEMANHGTEFDGRWKLLRERIEAMKAIWTDSAAEYHGEHVDFDPINQWPKPAQKPHPPIHVGGAAPGGARRAVRYGDGWIPLAGRGGDILDQLPILAEEADKAGRDVADIEVSMYFAPTDQPALERLRDGGVDRVVFGLPPAGDDELLPYLDQLAQVKDAVG
ncbi:MAG: LLM class flavin-dependent oxidoreductase, partial [Acidimicrobiales bacterium]